MALSLALSSREFFVEELSELRQNIPGWAGRDLYSATREGRIVLGESPWDVAVKPRPNQSAVAEFLLRPVLPSDPAASLLAGIERHPCPSANYQQTRHSLADALHMTVAAHLNDARQPGVLVTGGLDSSVIAALVHAMAGPPVLISIRAGLVSNTEIALQEALAAWLGAPLAVIDDIPPFTLDAVLAANRGSDLPVGGVFSHVWASTVQHAADLGVDVLFTGEGGNEVFADGPGLLRDHIRSRALGPALISAGRCGGSRSIFSALGGSLIADTVPDSPTSAVIARWLGVHATHRVAAASAHRRRVQQLVALGHTYAAAETALLLERHELYDALPTPDVRIASPLTDPLVASAGLGRKNWTTAESSTREKLLLRQVARRHLPAAISESPKVGRVDQLGAILRNHDTIDLAPLQLGADWLGVHLDDAFASPQRLPTDAALAWTRILAATAWAANARA